MSNIIDGIIIDGITYKINYDSLLNKPASIGDEKIPVYLDSDGIFKPCKDLTAKYLSQIIAPDRSIYTNEKSEIISSPLKINGTLYFEKSNFSDSDVVIKVRIPSLKIPQSYKNEDYFHSFSYELHTMVNTRRNGGNYHWREVKVPKLYTATTTEHALTNFISNAQDCYGFYPSLQSQSLLNNPQVYKYKDRFLTPIIDLSKTIDTNLFSVFNDRNKDKIVKINKDFFLPMFKSDSSNVFNDNLKTWTNIVGITPHTKDLLLIKFRLYLKEQIRSLSGEKIIKTKFYQVGETNNTFGIGARRYVKKRLTYPLIKVNNKVVVNKKGLYTVIKN